MDKIKILIAEDSMTQAMQLQHIWKRMAMMQSSPPMEVKLSGRSATLSH